MQTENTTSMIASDEISLRELIQKMGEWYRYLKTQWWKIAIAGVLGGCIGFVYAGMQPVTYTAKTSFVVEDSKGGGSLGGLASLAGQFGVDVGGGSGGGLFTGDNILLYFKSQSLAREVLLSKLDSSSNKTVADLYAEVYKLKENWAKNQKIGKLINFQPLSSNQTYTRLQDSLLLSITAKILKKEFIVARTDKKASFIEVTATMQNEQLAKLYCDRIVAEAVERYVSIKTKRQKSTVDKLQYRVDSIARLLNHKTSSGASLQTAATTLDINPLYRTNTTVAVETTTRDKMMLATIFGEVTKNLELAKFTLSQETPVIQIVDSPFLPLPSYKLSKTVYSISGFLITFLVTIITLILRKCYNEISF